MSTAEPYPRPLRVGKVGRWWVLFDAGPVLPHPMGFRTWAKAMRAADAVADPYRRKVAR